VKRLLWVTVIALVLTLAASAQSSTRAGARVTAHSSAYGKVLFSAAGKALYVFEADTGSASRCYGVCARAWPPLLTKGAPVAGSGVDHMLLGTTKRKGGSLQVTYRGHPLYTYSADKPGKIACQHVTMHGGLWLVIEASGRVNMAKGHMHMA
jgi:predicted lipoprotein with Yx(FWY)xxD motif